MRILIAVASDYGATLGVAVAIARVLRAADHVVEVQQASADGPASEYDAVVVGSGIYYGRWSPAATEFVRRNLGSLAHKPVWFFSVGGWRTQFSREELPEILALQAECHARDYRYFTGALNLKLLPVLGRVIARLGRTQYIDARNWRAIEAWATSIAHDLSLAAAK